ncbi:MAG: hypothetical protein ACLFTH_03825 [Candidatus Woesearchaeota archaeon]
MAKTVEISGESFKQLGDKINQSLKQARAWLINFFKTIDTYETIALGGMGLGLVLIITGIILM